MFNTLFLCTGNSCRSILAEAILNREGKDRFMVYSAGSFPKGEVNPHALALLKQLGYETKHFRSKSWDEFTGTGAPKIDFVFTVCDNAAAEACPVWVGHPMQAHWGIADPADAMGTDEEIAFAFKLAYDSMHRRISAFVNLPFETLDPISLKNRLKEIGNIRD